MTSEGMQKGSCLLASLMRPHVSNEQQLITNQVLSKSGAPCSHNVKLNKHSDHVPCRLAVKRRTSDGFPSMSFGDANLRMDHPTIFEENEEEETSIFNMGMPLDAAGTDAMFDFGVSNGTGTLNPSGAGSTFTTHQQAQAEQEMVEKRMSQMQIASSPVRSQRTTRDTSDMVSSFCPIPTVTLADLADCLEAAIQSFQTSL